MSIKLRSLSGGWVFQFAQCLGFDLADAFAGHVKLFADLFRVWSVDISMPKRMRSTLAFARVRLSRMSLTGVAQAGLHGGLDGAVLALVLDESPGGCRRRRRWAFPWRSAPWRSS